MLRQLLKYKGNISNRFGNRGTDNSIVGLKTDFHHSRILWVLTIMYIHFYLKWKKGCRQGACFPFQTGLSFITAVSYRATVRIIIVHRLECWTTLWQLIQVWRIRPDVSEMKSSLPLLLFLEGMDSSAPSPSSPCGTPHAQWQLEQMFSHKAQMGKEDKRQRCAEKEHSGNVKNPHSGEELRLLSAHACSL